MCCSGCSTALGYSLVQKTDWRSKKQLVKFHYSTSGNPVAKGNPFPSEGKRADPAPSRCLGDHGCPAAVAAGLAKATLSGAFSRCGRGQPGTGPLSNLGSGGGGEDIQGLPGPFGGLGRGREDPAGSWGHRVGTQ